MQILKKISFRFFLLLLILCLSIPNAKAQTYKAYQQVLKKVIHNDSIDYMELKHQLPLLEQAQAELRQIRPEAYKKMTQNEQEAFWINAYNMSILKLVVQRYPVKSIRDVGMPLIGPWFQNSFEVLGGKRSLRKMEKILWKEFRDPRARFALHFAAQSSPMLRSEPYRGETLDQQLDEAGKNYVQNPKWNKFDRGNDTIYLSELFIWNKKEFGQGRKLFEFLKPFLAPKILEYLDEHQMKIYYKDFNWSLNDDEQNKLFHQNNS